MKVAIFDIDGVLTKGFFIEEFWGHLASEGIIDKGLFERNLQNRKRYSRGEMSYIELLRTGMPTIAMAYKGAKQSDVKDAARKFLQDNKPELFDYTMPLIRMLKAKGVRLAAVSGSTTDLIENYTQLMGLDEVHGTQFAVQDGVYTGGIKVHMSLDLSKRNIVRGMSGEKVLGFGDSEQDLGILESVRVPVAMNPHKDLEMIAAKRKWAILNDGDDVVEKVRELIS